jgi:DNA-binding SARP family transcriptional activator
MPHPPTIVRSKVRVPALAKGVIERPRVRRALEDAAEGRRILVVVASPGSGKTTAVADFVTSRAGPRAWLTLGEADDSPGRFVTYLAAAIASIDRTLCARVRRLLAEGLAPADCSAILGESLPPGATVVIDDLHHVEARASVLPVLRAFLDAAADDALVVVISRRLVPAALSRHVVAGRAGAVPERALAFETGEIRDLLAARGLSAVPEEIRASSGGWAAGVMFEAVRGGRSEPSLASPEDPFFSYLGAEVIGALSPDLRRAVVRSALLDLVTPGGLESLLGVSNADALYEAICRHHLPATLEPEGLIYHPRFREFLLTMLRREDPDEMRTLTARHARMLLSDGHAEEAADHLLAAGELREAEDVVEAAAPALLSRGDWDKVLSWCAAFGEQRLVRRHELRGHHLRALVMGRRKDEMAALVRTMRATGEFDRLVAEAPDAATSAVFAIHAAGHWGSLLRLVPPDEASPGARALRYVLQVGSGSAPPREWPDPELARYTPNIGLLQPGLYFRGRFAEVERFCSLMAEQGPLTANLANIYGVQALRERGELADARAVLDASRSLIQASGWADFWRHAEAELVFAEGDREQGLGMIREARLMARHRGHQVADQAISGVAEGKMLVRMGMLSEAIERLGATRDWCIERALPCFREWADTWLAAAMLLCGEPLETPTKLLRAAIGGMERAERWLELPAADVFLAEAKWRAGDEAGHDAAADAAHAAAVRMGTLGPLLAALDDMPEVLARRIDAEGDQEGTWRALAHASRSSQVRSAIGRPVMVRTIGCSCLEVDGVETIVSPTKAIELAAALARAGVRGASRAALADELFEGSADAANYLRQLVHRLRRALPDGVELVSSHGRLAWRPAEAALAEDQFLEALVARSRREVGEARLATLARALEIADRGEFLPGVGGAAADRTRERLAALVSDARREYAQALLAAGRSTQAAAAAQAAVASDPYREDGWRLLMKAQAAARGPATALPTFLECVSVLGEVGLEPAQETRDLLERLRNPQAALAATLPRHMG